MVVEHRSVGREVGIRPGLGRATGGGRRRGCQGGVVRRCAAWCAPMGETGAGDVVALGRIVWVGVLGRMEDGGQGIWRVVDHGVGGRGGSGAGCRTLGSVGGGRGVVGSKKPLAGAVEEAYI